MDIDAKRALITRYLDAYNRFDVSAMMATVHDEVVFQNISDGAVTAQADGAEALRQMAEQATAMFTTRRQSMKDFAVDGEQAVISVDFEGVLACDLPNGMRAGQRIAVQGRSEFTFRDDRLVRIVDIS